MDETILLQAHDGEIDEQEKQLWQDLSAQQFKSAGLDGAQIINYVVELAPKTIPLIVAIIIYKIRARKHIKIIDRGTEIHGVSEDKVKEILETIYKHRNADEQTP